MLSNRSKLKVKGRMLKSILKGGGELWVVFRNCKVPQEHKNTFFEDSLASERYAGSLRCCDESAEEVAEMS
jgi:hypothetical protein